MPDRVDTLPRITPGQTWVSPRPRVQARTVVEITRDWNGRCVVYIVEGEPWLEIAILERAFAAWARRSGAWPRVEEVG